MAIRTYDILLDSYNSTMPEPIVGRQGDKNGAVTLHVTITDRGTAVNLNGQTINLMAETAKGTAVVADNAGVTLTDAVNGKFDYAIPNALWSESGKITKAYFSFNDTDGQQTTYDLIFIVKKAIDTSQDKAHDYITVIDGTVRDLQSKVDAIYATYQAGDFYSKAQTDSKDAATLASAKSYTDAQLQTVVKYATGSKLSTGSEVNINDLKTNGTYQFGGTLNWVGVPKDLAGQPRWGQLEVFNASDVTFQKIYTNVNELYFRNASGWPQIWTAWRKVQVIEVG